MSFVYPDKVTITRPLGGALASPGVQERYAGLDRDDEYLICKDVIASVQHAASRGTPIASVPSGSESQSHWDIYIPRRSGPPKGAIVARDAVIDDTGNRYQVIAAYYTPMGWTLRAERLEA